MTTPNKRSGGGRPKPSESYLSPAMAVELLAELVGVSDVARSFGVSVSMIKKLDESLKPMTWRGERVYLRSDVERFAGKRHARKLIEGR